MHHSHLQVSGIKTIWVRLFLYSGEDFYPTLPATVVESTPQEVLQVLPVGQCYDIPTALKECMWALSKFGYSTCPARTMILS